MFEQNNNSNGIWQLMTALTIGLKPQEEEALSGELKLILEMDPRQLEENIQTGKPISSIKGLDNNLVIILLWCQDLKNIRSLSYLVKLVCYEILKNQDYTTVCTTDWLIKKNLELNAYFKTISGERSWLTEFLNKATEPSVSLNYYMGAAALLVLLKTVLELQNTDVNTTNPVTDNALFALTCLCYLPIIRGSYQWASSFFAPPKPKTDLGSYIQPPTPVLINRP